MQTKKVVEYIVNWLRNYCEDAGLSGFVVGISGGIDSSVTSTLCAKTGKRVVVLDLPIGKFQGKEDLPKLHAEWLKERYKNVEYIRLTLDKAFEGLKNVFPNKIQDELTLANSRSRLRMLTLYAFSSHMNMLVVGTGNKIEDFVIGFFTKYGDGGVDISPIADLVKSEVYELAEELGIINEIIIQPPTDGLWGDLRTDEDQIGATYKELEWAMKIKKYSQPLEGLTKRQKQVLKIYEDLNDKNNHKMNPVPVCHIPKGLKSSKEDLLTECGSLSKD